MNQEDQKKREEAELRELRRKYARVFTGNSTAEEGQCVLLSLINKSSVFATTFTGNSKGMFYEGRRSIGLEILDMLYGEDDQKALVKLVELEKLNQIKTEDMEIDETTY